jgi:cellobiose-specific phosphotransferase system component IIB
MDMKIARLVCFGMAMSSLMVQGVNTFAAGDDQSFRPPRGMRTTRRRRPC